MPRAPRSAAASAADRAALPPPNTAMSYLAFNPESVLNANDAGNVTDDVLGLPPLDFVVDDAGEQDAGIAHDDVHRRDRLRGVIRERRIAVQRVGDDRAEPIVGQGGGGDPAADER